MKRLLVVVAIGLIGAGLYVHGMGKKDSVAAALVRAKVEFGATTDQINEIRPLLESVDNLTEDKADEIIISVVFPDMSDDEELFGSAGTKRWFWVGDLINDRLQGRGIIADANHGYIFPATIKTTNPLTHLVSFQQIYGTCGYHALANAHAVQKQVDEGKQENGINFADTKRYAQEVFKDVFVDKYSNELEQCALMGDEETGAVLEIADGKQIAVTSEQGDTSPPTGGGISKNANFFVLRNPNIDRAERRPVSTQFKTKAEKDARLAQIDAQMKTLRGASETTTNLPQKTQEELAALQRQRTQVVNEWTQDEKDKFIAALKADFAANPLGAGREQFLYSLMHHPATHFLILSPGHFTMLSVVKRGNKYHMYYLNSMNSPSLSETPINYIKLVDELITEAKKRLAGEGGGVAGAADEKRRKEEEARIAQEQKMREEQLRKQREQEEAARKAREEADAKMARELAEQMQREEEARRAQQARQEQERIRAQQEAREAAQREAERIAREQAARQASQMQADQGEGEQNTMTESRQQAEMQKQFDALDDLLTDW